MEINRNQLKEAIDAIFTSSKIEGRKFTGHRGCITKGYMDINDMSHCGDDNCPSCNMMSNALKEELEKWITNETNFGKK